MQEEECYNDCNWEECNHLHLPEILRLYMWNDKTPILTGVCPYCHNCEKLGKANKKDNLYHCESCGIETDLKSLWRQIDKLDMQEINQLNKESN